MLGCGSSAHIVWMRGVQSKKGGVSGAASRRGTIQKRCKNRKSGGGASAFAVGVRIVLFYDSARRTSTARANQKPRRQTAVGGWGRKRWGRRTDDGTKKQTRGEARARTAPPPPTRRGRRSAVDDLVARQKRWRRRTQRVLCFFLCFFFGGFDAPTLRARKTVSRKKGGRIVVVRKRGHARAARRWVEWMDNRNRSRRRKKKNRGAGVCVGIVVNRKWGWCAPMKQPSRGASKVGGGGG